MTAERYDYTMLSSAFLCALRCYFRHFLDLAPIEEMVSTALEFGAGMHIALETYNKEGLEKAIEKWREVYQRIGDEKRSVGMGEVLLKLWDAKNKEVDYEVLHLERLFNLDVEVRGTTSVLHLAGRVDGVVRWHDRVYDLERKTTTRLTGDVFEKARMNLQLGLYSLAVKAMYGECGGVVLEIIDIKQKPVLPRQIVQFEDWKLRDMVFSAMNKIREVEHAAMRAPYFLPADRNYVNCTYYGACPYWDICDSPPSSRENVIKQLFREEPWVPGGYNATIERVDLEVSV